MYTQVDSGIRRYIQKQSGAFRYIQVPSDTLGTLNVEQVHLSIERNN